MFSRIARSFGILKRRRPRHAAPPASARHPLHITHGPLAPLGTGLMGQRPFAPAPRPSRTDFTDPAPLAALAPIVAQDGHTVLMRTVVLPVVQVPVPAGSESPTMTLDAVSKAMDPQNWYPDLYRDCPDVPVENRPAARQLGAFHSPEGGTPCRDHAVQRALAEAFGHSTLEHPTSIFAEFFDTGESLEDYWAAQKALQETQATRRDKALVDFHRQSELRMNSTAPKRTGAPVCDTSIFATVARPQFTDTDRTGASS